MKSRLTEQEFQTISLLLGRKALGTYKIESTDKSGAPQVISVAPIVKSAPFPTLYWLICPKLKKAISHLERDGLIKTLEQELKENLEFQESIKKDHLRYIKQRAELAKSCLNAEEQEQYQKQKNWNEYGIGGIRDWTTIKCLHLHYAQFLVDGNSIGAIVDRELKTL